jgi:hypothetical protein
VGAFKEIVDCEKCHKDFRDFAEFISRWTKEYYTKGERKMTELDIDYDDEGCDCDCNCEDGCDACDNHECDCE